MDWKVPLFDIRIGEEEMDAVRAVMASGWLTMGPRIAAFEKAFAEFVGCRYAVAVNSGTAALHLALAALGVGRGDEVICPSLTFVATANAILYQDGTPVFVDIPDISRPCIAAETMAEKITERTKVIMLVHYAGVVCDMAPILAIAKAHDLKIVEDCAHAHGAVCGGKKAGHLGDIACFSFFSNKNMTTGEGGMVTTDDEDLAEKIKSMRSHGMTTDTFDRHRRHAFSYDVVGPGYNYRMDEIRAAFGMVQLKNLEMNQGRRRRICRRYDGRLSGVDGLVIPLLDRREGAAYHIFPVILPETTDRGALMRRMRDRGVQTSVHYPPVHRFRYYRDRILEEDVSLPLTETYAARELTLPLYPDMTGEQVTLVCDALLSCL